MLFGDAVSPFFGFRTTMRDHFSFCFCVFVFDYPQSSPPLQMDFFDRSFFQNVRYFQISIIWLYVDDSGCFPMDFSYVSFPILSFVSSSLLMMLSDVRQHHQTKDYG
jgi:hypothetical protein